MAGNPRLPSDMNLASKSSKGQNVADFIINTEKTIAKAKVCLQAAQQRQKEYADQQSHDLYYSIGYSAWLSSERVTIKSVGSPKMLALWLGPFKVITKTGPVN